MRAFAAGWSVVGLAVVLAVSGCLGPASPGCADCLPEPDASTGANETRTFYLKPAWGLSEEPPASAEPQRLGGGDFWVRYETGGDQPTFRSDDLANGFLIESATLRFWFEADAPVPKTGAGDVGFAEWDAWMGADEAFNAVVAMNGPDALQPGVRYELHGEVPLPAGGLVVEGGERLALMLRPVMLQTEPNDAHLLVDAEATPSALTLVVRPLDGVAWVDGGRVLVTTDSGSLPAPAYAEAALGREPSAATTGRYAFQVPPDATKVVVLLSGAVAVGGKDLDLVLFDANGTAVVQSVTPYAREHARLYAANLALAVPGLWTAQVNNWLGAGATYMLTTKVWVPEAGDPSGGGSPGTP